jgi:hypothetical protein
MPSTNLANTSAFRQRSLRPGTLPCDITCQTQTPAAPQARHHSAHERPPSLSSEPARATRMLGHTRPRRQSGGGLAESASSWTFSLVATPQYLTRRGAPESPDDLHLFRRSSLSSKAPCSLGGGSIPSFEQAIWNTCTARGAVSLNEGQMLGVPLDSHVRSRIRSARILSLRVCGAWEMPRMTCSRRWKLSSHSMRLATFLSITVALILIAPIALASPPIHRGSREFMMALTATTS